MIIAEKANVRLGPSVQAPKLFTLKSRDTVLILGRTIDWYHTKLPNGTQGFIYRTLIGELGEKIDNIGLN